jgi:hypothetical protein
MDQTDRDGSAIKVEKYSTDTEGQFGNNDPTEFDTYANLLYKTGRGQEAIEWEKRPYSLTKDTITAVQLRNGWKSVSN